MKIEITHRCRVRGVDCLPGTIIETDNGTAAERIGMGRAKKYVEPPPQPGDPDEGGEGATADSQGTEAEGGKKGKKGERK